MTIAYRDLSEPELWERSLARSRQRRALAPKLRREDRRRKRLSAAVAAATMAGPSTPMAMAAASGNAQSDVAAAPQQTIEVREGGLPLTFGSEGPLVAEVQRALGIAADGIFGIQTDAAVRRYQSRTGLQVDGIVGPSTWSALIEHGSAVGGSNVPEKVKDRIAATLQTAGRQVGGSAATGQPTDAAAPTTTPAPGSTSPIPGATSPTAAPEATSPAPATPSPAPTNPSPTNPSPAPESPVSEKRSTTPDGGSCGSSTIATPVKGTVTSEFGPRWGRQHEGIDIAAPSGTAVRAAACGSVTIAGQQSGYGNIVCITHTSQFSTCYAHLSRFGTTQGAHVKQGQVIGYVGCTGNCTGPHLHFETRVGGQPQNPRQYLGGASIPGRSTASRVAATSSHSTTAASRTRSSASRSGGGSSATTAGWSSSSGSATASETATPAAHEAVQASTPATQSGATPGPAAPLPITPAPTAAAPAPTPDPTVPAPATPSPEAVAPTAETPSAPATAPTADAPAPTAESTAPTTPAAPSP